MDVYGLTGGIGSGKSTVAALLESHGIPVLSADALARVVVARGSEGLRDVVARFGPAIVDKDGALDRKKLAAHVFACPTKRTELEAIVHPRIRQQFIDRRDALEKAGHGLIVYEVPLLFENNLQHELAGVILVTSDETTRVGRVISRDHSAASDVRARIAVQLSDEVKRRHADYVIDNDGSCEDLRKAVETMLVRFFDRPCSRSSRA